MWYIYGSEMLCKPDAISQCTNLTYMYLHDGSRDKIFWGIQTRTDTYARLYLGPDTTVACIVCRMFVFSSKDME